MLIFEADSAILEEDMLDPYEDIYSEEEPEVLPKSSLSFVTDSVSRLFSGDFSSFNGDFAVSMLFIGLCILSWQFVLYLFQRVSKGKHVYRPGSRLPHRNRESLGQGAASAPTAEQQRAVGNAATETENHREADVRAAGDSWDQDDYDPDYDANNDIMVMLLQDQPDDSDEPETPVRSDNEDENLLNEMIMRPEDEPQIIELDNEENSPTAVDNQTNVQNSAQPSDGAASKTE